MTTNGTYERVAEMFKSAEDNYDFAMPDGGHPYLATTLGLTGAGLTNYGINGHVNPFAKTDAWQNYWLTRGTGTGAEGLKELEVPGSSLGSSLRLRGERIPVSERLKLILKPRSFIDELAKIRAMRDVGKLDIATSLMHDALKHDKAAFNRVVNGDKALQTAYTRIYDPNMRVKFDLIRNHGRAVDPAVAREVSSYLRAGGKTGIAKTFTRNIKKLPNFKSSPMPKLHSRGATAAGAAALLTSLILGADAAGNSASYRRPTNIRFTGK